MGAQEGIDSKSNNQMSLCVCVRCISLFGLLVHWYVRWPPFSVAQWSFLRQKICFVIFLSLVAHGCCCCRCSCLLLSTFSDSNGERTEHKFGFFESICDESSNNNRASSSRYLCNTYLTWNFIQNFIVFVRLKCKHLSAQGLHQFT